MSSAELRELNAYYALFSTYALPKTVTTPSDLSDGAALWVVLSSVDEEYFKPPTDLSPDNWVLRFTALKRLYRLMTQYLSDALHQPNDTYDVPALQEMAKESNPRATLVMCRLVVTIAIQCEHNADIIQRIQGLGEADQAELKRAIEHAMAHTAPQGGDRSVGEISMTEDDHFYQIQHDRSRVLQEKGTLEKVYQTLLEEHRTLQTNLDDMTSERADALATVRRLQQESESRRDTGAEPMLKAEIDRLRIDLQKSEDNLAITETELDKHTSLVTDLTRRVDELQGLADQAAKLKDQVDEYRHASDRLQKTENVMEKYKKKLQEGADLRQQVKSLEKQNADLVDKHASLEEEFRKIAHFRPLMDSYKTQVAELEQRAAARAAELEGARFEAAQAKDTLRAVEAERARDADTLELYQERVRELELSVGRTPARKPAARAAVDSESDAIAESGSRDTVSDATSEREPGSAIDAPEEELDEGFAGGLGGELDDALSGTTMTELKLQLGRLQRELAAARTNSAEASRVLVLENLLDDARRMKSRYEADYLAAHREKLKLQSDLEEIRSGKALGDGAEAAIALRQRLNETVDELDALRKQYAELEVKFESQAKELTIAKSDLNLVNKDQLEILATLRESVNEDKAGLEAETSRLEKQIKELSEKNRMQLEQINGLLMEKVNLQTEGIGQREKMLQRERDIGDLRGVLSGRDLPEDIKTRLLSQHEDSVQLQAQIHNLNDKLAKARQFIKQQDKLFKEEYGTKSSSAGSVTGAFDEAETSYKSEIIALREELARQKRTNQEAVSRYRREQEVMFGHVHQRGMADLRAHLGSHPTASRPQPKSWLAQQRKQLGPTLQRA